MQGINCCGLESKVRLVIAGNLSDKALEGQLSDKELGTFLILSDFSECDGTWSESVRLLN